MKRVWHATYTYVRGNLFALLFLILVFGSMYHAGTFVVNLDMFVHENRFVSAALFAFGICVSTVLAPVTMLPLVPMMSPILGPFVTGLASWIGWTSGSVLAFMIARYGGRPFLSRMITIEKLARYEDRLPKEVHFSLILALRLVFPVDLLSYIFGAFSTVRLMTYTIASGLGILWFSFAFAYLGYAFDSGDTVLFVSYGVGSLILFGGALAYAWRTLRKST